MQKIIIENLRSYKLFNKLQESGDLRRKMDLEVKVFDGGAAFRYHLYDDHRLVTREISQEMTGFRLPDGAHAWVADYEGHVTSQEKEFFKTAVSSIKPETVAAKYAIHQ